MKYFSSFLKFLRSAADGSPMFYHWIWLGLVDLMAGLFIFRGRSHHKDTFGICIASNSFKNWNTTVECKFKTFVTGVFRSASSSPRKLCDQVAANFKKYRLIPAMLIHHIPMVLPLDLSRISRFWVNFEYPSPAFCSCFVFLRSVFAFSHAESVF